jgi:type IV secretion system protein VirB6
MFNTFKVFGDEIVSLLNPSSSLTLVAGFQAIIITWATIYIMYIGYMSFLGKVDNPVRQVLYKLLLFMFISLFAFNTAGWYTYSIDAIKGLVSWISGGGTDAIYAKLDDGLKMIANIAQVYEDNDSSTFEIKSALASIIIYGAYFAVALLVAILLVLNVVTLQVIIILAPFAFVSLFFPLVRGIFDRWIELIISNVFTIFFISLFFNTIFEKYKKILTGLDPITTTTTGVIWDTTEVDIFLSAFTVLGFSVLGFMLILMSIGLASKLSSVSIESLPKSAAIATAATAYIGGKTVKSTYKAGKNAGNAGYEAGKNSINAVSGISRSAGNAGSKAHTLLKQTGKKAKAERKAGGKKN